jgi:glycerophosphoryl diester phosphodiesterase
MFIYAHRGASADYPEMTEAAYRGAIDQGADGFECDLRLTRDEVPVLWHNPSMLERAGNHGLIAEMNFSEVSKAYPQVLTLDQFLDISLNANKSVLIETKHPAVTRNRVEEILLATLKMRKVTEKIHVSVMSFSWLAIEKVHRMAPELHTTFLASHKTPWTQVRFTSANAIGPGITEVRTNTELIQKIRKLGKEVSVWTVDEPSDIELCKKLGVDNLITNTPAHARTFL